MHKENVKQRYAAKISALGERIKSIRLSKNITQEQLADLCKISLNSITLIENGKLNPSAGTLFAIADGLKVKERDFFED